ncbi:hypothetical protein [Thiomicrospira sp. XS5]|uniref:hypothetical protein n=1 Tax=Thiomicrospira sp. XS5 TaxID=1775636 RepID=UPI00128F242A|nr:hypothetical protein [Thiomicrospira sp. XS5]
MNNTPTEYELSVRKEHRNNCRAFAGFLFVIVLAIIAKPPNSEYMWIILTLLSISIPTSIASVNIERNTIFGQQQNSKPLHVFSMVFMYIPAILAISMLISTVSAAAGATFAITSFIWLWVVIAQRRNA